MYMSSLLLMRNSFRRVIGWFDVDISTQITSSCDRHCISMHTKLFCIGFIALNSSFRVFKSYQPFHVSHLNLMPTHERVDPYISNRIPLFTDLLSEMNLLLFDVFYIDRYENIYHAEIYINYRNKFLNESCYCEMALRNILRCNTMITSGRSHDCTPARK